MKKNKNVLLSITDIIKTIGGMGVSLGGHYHPDIGEPFRYGRLGNFVDLVNLTICQGNTSLEKHLKTCSSRKIYISKTNQNILLNFCSDAITETIIKRVNDAQYFCILCDEASETSNKAQFILIVIIIDLILQLAHHVK